MDFDVVISGGGLVGAALALALAPTRLRVAVVEKSIDLSNDPRTLALAYGSQRILDTLGFWCQLDNHPINHIHISEQNSLGITHLYASDLNLPALGYTISAGQLAQILRLALAQSPVTYFSGQTIETLYRNNGWAELTLSGGQTVRCSVVVAADGMQSTTRRQAGMTTWQSDYQQQALVADITTQSSHDHKAWERFTKDGPMALLPKGNGHWSLVAALNETTCQHWLHCEPEAFLHWVGTQMGGRVVAEQLQQRVAFPLHLLKSWQHYRHRVVAIGNAAHTLHPLAAQGLNVGLRDAAALAQVLYQADEQGEDIGTSRVLKRYAQWRRWDQQGAVVFTDGLARLIGQPWLAPWRQSGLLALNGLPFAKRRLLAHTTGTYGRLPWLALGVPLTESHQL